MKATILYSKSNLSENDASHTIMVGGRVFEGVSTLCAIKVHGKFTAKPAHYEYVARAETSGDTAKDADALWATLNGYGDACVELDRQGAVRSMSVGDVVIFESGRAFVCQGCGWEETRVGRSFVPLCG